MKVGEFGTFRPSVGSKGADTEKAFDAATMMKRPTLSFIPGKVLQAVRDTMTFTRVKNEDEKLGGGTGEDDRPGEL